MDNHIEYEYASSMFYYALFIILIAFLNKFIFFMGDISANYLFNNNFCLVGNLVHSWNLFILLVSGLIRLLVFFLSLV